jgi:aspartyl-tRNA(Asn)/glutamyl-tRNA(Gln) amidotransferase subunit C
MLTSEDVTRLAELARLDLTEEELTMMVGQLDVILDAVASVSALADTDIGSPGPQGGQANVFRPDEVGQSLPASEVLAMAPRSEDSRFRVPRILGE